MKSSNEKITKGLMLQLISLIILIILVVLAIFFPFMIAYANIVAGVTFFIIAYNKRNQDKKALVSFCIICGLLFIIMGGWSIING